MLSLLENSLKERKEKQEYTVSNGIKSKKKKFLSQWIYVVLFLQYLCPIRFRCLALREKKIVEVLDSS